MMVKQYIDQIDFDDDKIEENSQINIHTKQIILRQTQNECLRSYNGGTTSSHFE